MATLFLNGSFQRVAHASFSINFIAMTVTISCLCGHDSQGVTFRVGLFGGLSNFLYPFRSCAGKFSDSITSARSANALLTLNTIHHVFPEQWMTSLAMRLGGILSAHVFTTANKFHMNRVTARGTTAQVVQCTPGSICRQWVRGPCKQQAVQANLRAMQPGASVPPLVQTAHPDPARSSVELDRGRYGDLRKEPSKIFPCDRTNGKIWIRHLSKYPFGIG